MEGEEYLCSWTVHYTCTTQITLYKNITVPCRIVEDPITQM